MSDFLDEVERELRSTAPMMTRAALMAFRSQLDKSHTTRSRKSFERRLEAFIQSRSIVRDAARRYIRRVMPPLLVAAEVALKKARTILANYNYTSSKST